MNAAFGKRIRILENFKSDDKYKEFVEAILGEEEMQIEPQADQVVVL